MDWSEEFHLSCLVFGSAHLRCTEQRASKWEHFSYSSLSAVQPSSLFPSAHRSCLWATQSHLKNWVNPYSCSLLSPTALVDSLIGIKKSRSRDQTILLTHLLLPDHHPHATLCVAMTLQRDLCCILWCTWWGVHVLVPPALKQSLQISQRPGCFAQSCISALVPTWGGCTSLTSVKKVWVHRSICRANRRYVLFWLAVLFSDTCSYSFPCLFPFAEYLRSETAFLEELVFGSGDTIELSCNTQGSSVSVFWFKDGIGIAPTNRTHIGQKLLKIINVSYDDSGLYSCKPRHSNEVLGNFTVRVTGRCRNTAASLIFFFCIFAPSHAQHSWCFAVFFRTW